MSSLWQSSSYSPSGALPEIDSSSVRLGDHRALNPAWPKQEQDELSIIKWENLHTGGNGPDVVQDNTPSSAMSSGSAICEGLPPRVLMTITKLQCLLERKQERIAALERQVEDLMQDRKFLRSQIENLTSNRPSTAYVPPGQPAADAPKSQHVDARPRKRERERAASDDSLSHASDSDESVSTDISTATSEHRRKRRSKDRKRGKRGKDYSRKRATGIQYVIHRYKQVLAAYNKKKNMTKAFRHYGIDRNTIANTASIAELHLACKDTAALVGTFRHGEETLVNYAQRCALCIDCDVDLSRRIDLMKTNGELLPISVKRARGAQSHFQPLGGDIESIVLS
ncbi:hypothetical protein NHX12_021876 [Muraenolepis orangiensis]|uniref:Coiled-coil domain-containing protein 106-like n=1 Tax=Muraenolepis orangiensis TaxID=630683 RepID=A0A9Q0IVY8_9TELE|nr:hypothetical protein NHX12_021876 [Muraenolepis orangiensis]